MTSTRIMTSEERSSFTTNYPEFSSTVTNTFQLPGLAEGYTPQGITSLNDELLLISLYREFHIGSKMPSLFAVLNGTDMVGVYNLHLEDGTPFYGHVGGVTKAKDFIWTVDDYQLYGFKADDILDSLSSVGDNVVQDLKATHHKFVDAKASFVFNDGNENLWIGDFYEPGFIFTIPGWHQEGWVAGYELDSSGVPTASDTYDLGTKGYNVLKPDTALFIKQGIQGFLKCDNVVGLSQAFGLYDASIALYESPFNGDTERVELPDGTSLAVYKIAEEPAHKVSLPTGSEDLDCKCGKGGRNEAAVLFESASYIYKEPIRLAGGNIDDRAFTFVLPEV